MAEARPLQTDELRVALRAWHLPVRRISALTGGWNSATWLVETDSGARYVAKLADHHDATPFVPVR